MKIRTMLPEPEPGPTLRDVTGFSKKGAATHLFTKPGDITQDQAQVLDSEGGNIVLIFIHKRLHI